MYHSYYNVLTAGPNALTVADFWRLIWEQHVGIIAMVTTLYEGGRVSRFYSMHICFIVT